MKLKRNQLLLPFIIMIIFAGCTATPQAEADHSAQIQSDILEKMADQKHYSFQGTTSITLSEKEMEDFVQFNGFINNKDNMYMDLSIASIEGMAEEKMQFVQLPNKMMVRYAEEDEWEEIDKQQQTLFSELKNWNPEYFLSMMQSNTVHTEEIKENDKHGLFIQLNQEAVREQIADQLRSTLNGGLTEKDIQEMKENLGLTNEEIAEMQGELEEQMQATEDQIEEMLRTMQVEAHYTVFYDPSTLLIKQIEQNIRTNYQMEGEEIKKKMMIHMQLSDYGKERSLPLP
ncbi:MAG TPA: hypothetical protein ENN58_03465 [bacterium]|nr:hypothetical protein [bacterium]